MKNLITVHINTERTWRGGEQQTLYLLEGLRRRGHDAILAARPGSPLMERAEACGLETFPIRPLNEADLFCAWSLARFLRARRPHLLHMHSSHALFLGSLAACLAPGIRRVVHRRLESTIYRRFSFRLNWLKYRFGADRIVAISQAVKNQLIRDGLPPGQIAVVHSGIDGSSWPPPEKKAEGEAAVPASRLKAELRLPPHAPLLLAVGALELKKGHGILLEALPQVLERQEAVLAILGEGPQAPELERQVERLGLRDRVRLLGFREDVQEILSAASIFVLPTLSEGLGTAILEALLLEKPVIASSVGGIPEIIEQRRHGLLVPPGDPAALAQGILEVLSQPQAAAQRARAGRRRVLESFSADQMVEKTLAVYEELLAQAKIFPGWIPRSNL
ncbi:MAG: glycosyltransferase [Planctomycetes bacterium]|nr:glycosyltransferase [Planctomycetota bacterium]